MKRNSLALERTIPDLAPSCGLYSTATNSSTPSQSGVHSLLRDTARLASVAIHVSHTFWELALSTPRVKQAVSRDPCVPCDIWNIEADNHGNTGQEEVEQGAPEGTFI